MWEVCNGISHRRSRISKACCGARSDGRSGTLVMWRSGPPAGGSGDTSGRKARGGMAMRVEVSWDWLPGEDHADPAWRLTEVLYAYIARGTGEVLYIGKADRATVRKRWVRSGKE